MRDLFDMTEVDALAQTKSLDLVFKKLKRKSDEELDKIIWGSLDESLYHQLTRYCYALESVYGR